MLTIHGITDDEDQLLELFGMLDRPAQAHLLRAAGVAAIASSNADIARSWRLALEPDRTTVAIVSAALWKCAPPLPCGWISDTGFQDAVESAVRTQLGSNAVPLVLTTSDHDTEGAEHLLDMIEEIAHRLGPDYCAPKFEEGYVPVETMQQFIRDWRESFISNLRRSQRPTGA